jgi:hypothetical protein
MASSGGRRAGGLEQEQRKIFLKEVKKWKIEN